MVIAVEHLSLAFRFFTVCWLGYALYYSSVHSCQVKWEWACPSLGAEVCFTFHVVIAGDSFYYEQIIFRWLMGLSCSNLGSDEFCFHWESKICSNRVAGFFGCECLIFVFVFVALCICTCGGIWVLFWQQVLNLLEQNIWSLPRSVLIYGRERSTRGQRSISDNLTHTKLSEIDFSSWLKSVCSQADIFSSWVRLAHTNILG